MALRGCGSTGTASTSAAAVAPCCSSGSSLLSRVLPGHGWQDVPEPQDSPAAQGGSQQVSPQPQPCSATSLLCLHFCCQNSSYIAWLNPADRQQLPVQLRRSGHRTMSGGTGIVRAASSSPPVQSDGPWAQPKAAWGPAELPAGLGAGIAGDPAYGECGLLFTAIPLLFRQRAVGHPHCPLGSLPRLPSCPLAHWGTAEAVAVRPRSQVSSTGLWG